MGRICLCIASLTLLLSIASAQDCKKLDYGSDLQKYMEGQVQQFSSCHAGSHDAACSAYLAQALDRLYGVKDFGGAKYMTPSEIGKKVASDAAWEHLGSATDQEALKKAQGNAGCGRAVIAVMASDTGGHVAIILPGPTSHSNGWKLDVPNSASFFMHNPGKSFSGKPLSYSFPKPDGIELYAKK
ncbi:MAG TPA: hypothetical protein VKZ53_01560 [Candidatus Angelobacter sp.]|nr:hypothetical protein [Candidatus Angelobacter sp.]